MRKNNLIKKGLVVAVILLFFSVSVIPSTVTTEVKQITMPTAKGDTLYVGGNGTGNYSKIQNAINDSSDGDTVFVYDDSSPYYENVIVDKSISLIGEDRDSTVIDGVNDVDAVNITADSVTLSGFTIQKIENDSKNNAISIQSNYNVISGNIITGNTNTWHGIYIFHSEYSIISGNTITSVYRGIGLFRGEYNNISGNIIKDCRVGIELFWYSNNNSIFGNTLTNNTWGISPKSINDVISLNNISYNFYGISIFNCFNYKITRNNFIGNNWSVHFTYSLFFAYQFGYALKDIHSTIKWDGNYWDRPRIFPKPILGWLTLVSIPWFQFDWHPAQEPYDIGV